MFTSTAVTVTTRATFIISDPSSIKTCYNVNGDLTVTASGGAGALSATCQWYSNTTQTNSGGTLISGANSNIYTVPASSVENLTRYYYVTVTDGGGCGA